MLSIRRDIRELYSLLEVEPGCSDRQLRDSYRALLRRHHPDVNQDSVATATEVTRHIISAYAGVIQYRQTYGQGISPTHVSADETSFFSGIGFSINIGNPFAVSLTRIARLKNDLRKAWTEFESRRFDVKAALRLVHAALRGGRPDLVDELLRNEALVASAPILMDIVPPDDAAETVLMWAKRLRECQQVELAITLLHDVAGISGISSRRLALIKEALRSLHYSFVQKAESGKQQAGPSERIIHLRAIIALGYQAGFVYKQMAEAFHELGDDEQARQNLQRALTIDPDLQGAKTIMRALGVLGEEKIRRDAPGLRKAYSFSRSEQIPTIAAIFDCWQNDDWERVIAYADAEKYSPRLIPSAREVFVATASVLGECCGDGVLPLLTKMLSSVYWDVRQAAMLALAKVGGHAECNRLKQISPEQPFTLEVVAYAEARLAARAERVLTSELLQEAGRRLQTESYQTHGEIGRIRSRLEIALKQLGESPETLGALSMLCRYCLRMQDWARVLKLLPTSSLPVRIEKQSLELHVMAAKALAIAGMHDSALDRLNAVHTQLPAELRERAVGVVWDVVTNPKFHGTANLLWAIRLVLDNAIEGVLPADCLARLHRLARAMEPIGEKDFALWLRYTLRAAAPGHYYGDSHDRLNYFKPPIADPNLRFEIHELCERFKPHIVRRIKDVLGEGNAIPTSPSDRQAMR